MPPFLFDRPPATESDVLGRADRFPPRCDLRLRPIVTLRFAYQHRPFGALIGELPETGDRDMR